MYKYNLSHKQKISNLEPRVLIGVAVLNLIQDLV